MADSAAEFRLDKWLWAARFFKTRGLAAEAVDGGKVAVNGERAKRARHLSVGDELRVRLGPYEHVVVIRALSQHRGPASQAVQLYEETEDSRERRRVLAAQLKAAAPDYRHQKGKPDKKERRDIRRLKGDG